MFEQTYLRPAGSERLLCARLCRSLVSRDGASMIKPQRSYESGRRKTRKWITYKACDRVRSDLPRQRLVMVTTPSPHVGDSICDDGCRLDSHWSDGLTTRQYRDALTSVLRLADTIACPSWAMRRGVSLSPDLRQFTSSRPPRHPARPLPSRTRDSVDELKNYPNRSWKRKSRCACLVALSGLSLRLCAIPDDLTSETRQG